MSRAKRDSTDQGRNRVPLEEPVFASTQNSSLIEKRHQQIVEGACTVFFKKGYHPTTTREIAEACGMSIGQLYHYISTKDDVLYLVHKHMQKIWYDYLNKSDIEKIDNPLEKMKEALHHSLVFMIENRKLIQFVYSESKYLEERHLRIVLDMDQKNVVGFWYSLLKDLKKTNKVKVELDLASSIIAYLLAFLALRGWTLTEKPNRKHVESMVDFILRGLGTCS